MSAPLFEHVLELAASSAFARPASDSALRALREIEPSGKARLLGLLREHRLQHLFWYSIAGRHGEDFLSMSQCEALRIDFERCRLDQAAQQWAFISLSDTLSRAGIDVIACKGVILARDYYPLPGLRRMHDIDLWLNEPDISKCAPELAKLGFKERTDKASPEAHNFVNQDNIVLDVHTKMRLFQDKGHDLMDLSEPASGLPFRVFIPEAKVAHLLAHLLGHAAKTGILICWIIDIALVLRAHPMNPDLIKKLLRDDGSWQAFLRLLRTFLELGWIDDSFGLDRDAESVRPIKWDTLLRQRRLCGWAGVRGKLRLGKTLALGTPLRAPLPRATDYLWQPLDWIFEQNPLAARYGALLVPREDRE